MPSAPGFSLARSTESVRLIVEPVFGNRFVMTAGRDVTTSGGTWKT
jgi:hypothetical protein